MGKLGCGEWHAYLQCRGGGVLTELPVSGISMSRRLDETSGASVTVTGASLSRWTATQREQCCGYLSEVRSWQHELALYRGDGADPAWVGPILEPVWGVDSVTIPARDLFQWFERRLLQRERNLVGWDLADVFYRYVIDALTRDPTPNISVVTTNTGIAGDRVIVPGAYRRAADELRELARSGVDFTALGRSILVGGVEIPTDAIGPLITEHFAAPGPTLTDGGIDAETESIVVGASGPTRGDPVVGIAGGIDAALGLLQGVTNESSIEDEESVQAAAESRNDMLAESPQLVSGRLVADAPVGFEDLVPGAHADLRLALFCKEVDDVFRLQDVNVSVGVSGDVVEESVNVTFVTLGTTEAA